MMARLRQAQPWLPPQRRKATPLSTRRPLDTWTAPGTPRCGMTPARRTTTSTRAPRIRGGTHHRAGVHQRPQTISMESTVEQRKRSTRVRVATLPLPRPVAMQVPWITMAHKLPAQALPVAEMRRIQARDAPPLEAGRCKATLAAWLAAWWVQPRPQRCLLFLRAPGMAVWSPTWSVPTVASGGLGNEARKSSCMASARYDVAACACGDRAPQLTCVAVCVCVCVPVSVLTHHLCWNVRTRVRWQAPC